MKYQALFSFKDKSKKLKCCFLKFLFGGLRVKFYPYCCQRARKRKTQKKEKLAVITQTSCQDIPMPCTTYMYMKPAVIIVVFSELKTKAKMKKLIYYQTI